MLHFNLETLAKSTMADSTNVVFLNRISIRINVVLSKICHEVNLDFGIQMQNICVTVMKFFQTYVKDFVNHLIDSPIVKISNLFEVLFNFQK